MLLSWLRNWSRRPQASPRPRRTRRYLPALEGLESRWTPSVTPTRLTFLMTEGTATTPIVASFTSNDPTPQNAANYSASINWGDGTTVSGSVTANLSGGFNVSGTHTYTEEGIFPVNVS